MIRDIFYDYFPHILITIVVSSIVFFTLDFFLGKDTIIRGVVKEKIFVPSRVSTETGLTGDGKLVTTVTSTNDEYIVFINLFSNDETVNRRIDKDTWLTVEKGQILELNVTTGKFTNIWY